MIMIPSHSSNFVSGNYNSNPNATLKRQQTANTINQNAPANKNLLNKKHQSISSASGVQQLNPFQLQTSRFGNKPHFEVANIGLRKGSMQQHQLQGLSIATQQQNVPQLSKNNKSQNELAQMNIPVNSSITRMQNQIADNPTGNLLLASLEQLSMNQVSKQSRNSNIPKASSAQNPIIKSHQSSMDHATITYQLIKSGAYHTQNRIPPTSQNQQLIQFQKYGDIQRRINGASTSHLRYHPAGENKQISIHSTNPNNHMTQCETGASIDMHQSMMAQSQLFHQRPVSNIAVIGNHLNQDTIVNQTDLLSMQSSIISEENTGNTATASLLEGSVGVQLPQSKINTAARRHQLVKNTAKDVGDEGENLNQSDEEYVQNSQQRRELMRSTIIDKDVHQESTNQFNDQDSLISAEKQAEDISQDLSSSSQDSYDPNDGDGILPLLESFVKKNELDSMKQFACLIKGDTQKALIYRAIEQKQIPMLKYLLTETQKIILNLNLLHIACRQRDNSNEQKEVEIIKTILKYDRFADVNSQDTYGNTPIHLAAQNGKQQVLQFILSTQNPNIYIKNSENQLALHASTSQEILKVIFLYINFFLQIFVAHIQKMKENMTKNEDSSQDNQIQNSNRSHKQKRIMSRNKSEHQLSSAKKQISASSIEKSTKRAPLKDISNRIQNDQSSLQMSVNQKSKRQQQTEQKKENQHYQTEPSSRLRARETDKSKDIQQYESIMDFCSKQASQQKQKNHYEKDKKYLLFREDEFEKVVEFTESDEEGSSQDAKEMEDQDNDSQGMQFCDEIREISDESFKNSMLIPESKIGPKSFEPISLLGSGSFGEVYLVKKKDSNQLFAMKVLQKQKIMGQNLVKYAITERNVLSYTRHPFIVGLNYAFQTRDKLFLILDYCPGGDLGKVLTKEKRLTEDRARVYLAEILLALEDLHKRDIIFRDLKPDNVVLDENGHVLLTDFGLSKEGVLDNQAAKSFCGSVAYLAPEMLRRTGHGKSVDWYLLGVLLYEMLVGIPPYFNNNREKLFQGIERGPLLIPAQFSKEAKALLIGLLSKNSMKRLGAGPRDAEEIKEHEFFKDINWDDVQQRKLQPPKPEIREIKMLEFPQKLMDEFKQSIYGDLLEDENRLAGWSFATPHTDLIHNNIINKIKSKKKFE